MNILVIDDSPEIRESLKRLLEDSGHKIMTAAYCSEGLRLLHKKAFDFIFTDLCMPRLSDSLPEPKAGLDVIREIRRKKVRAHVWLMSAALDNKVAKEALHLGAEEAVDKMKIVDVLAKHKILT
ncbi:MAG TPA: response regulator [Candidatus Paceibacterota bacterium]|nr:response regulator [Candidatus Paceibacterota bacterium]